MLFVVTEPQGLEVYAGPSADEAADAALVAGEGATLTAVDGAASVDYFVEGGRLVDAAGDPVPADAV